MEWKLCLICQKQTAEALKCPLSSLHKEVGLKSYTSFLDILKEAREINPSVFDAKLEKAVTVEELIKNKASWHKSCRLRFTQSKLDRERQKLKRKSSDSSDEPERRLKRQSTALRNVCMFCGDDRPDELHQILSLGVDEKVRRMATELQDKRIIAIVSEGDLVALERKYHTKCLLAFQRRYTSFVKTTNSDQLADVTREKEKEARVFAEIVDYMENALEDGTYHFTLSELHKLFEARLHRLNVNKSINKTRLKNQILLHFQDEIQEQSDGKRTVLIFKGGVELLLKDKLSNKDKYSDAFELANVAKQVRNEVNLFKSDAFNFSGEFSPQCQSTSVPNKLKCLVSMLLYGANIDNQESDDSQACLTIAQSIMFNMKSKFRPKKETRHHQDRETPLPLYIGLNIHAQTRSRKLIDQMFQLGLSVSYTRVDQILKSLATSVCNQYKKNNIVCPLNLRKGLFTVGAIDNIDHNPSSTTSQNSFHGTAMSVFQCPASETDGARQPAISIEADTERDITLPSAYSTVPSCAMKVSDVAVPQSDNASNNFTGRLEDAISQEHCWMEYCYQNVTKDLSDDHYITWSGYHSSLMDNHLSVPSLSGLMPLFEEKAATVSMMKHGLDINKEVTEYLNPGQTPVIACDQPIFALAKFVQWNWPHLYGENIYVVMLGGLHIEMALWNVCGDLLEASGWTSALVEANVATSGTAESFLKVSHLARTRQAHQITAVALYNLMKDAYSNTREVVDEEDFVLWQDDMKKKFPTFSFWHMIMQLEVSILIFVKAHRENNFLLYVEVLESLVPWFFALDHTNYSRWLPVHIRDMKSLPEAIRTEFEKHWVISKSSKNFSFIPIDQAHEQNNAVLKGSGGIIGLTENKTALRRWMVAGPEISRILKEFEAQLLGHDEGFDERFEHHNQGMASQKAFQSHITNLVNAISELGNPFSDCFPELVTLDTRNCADESVVKRLQSIEAVGLAQYKKFVKDVLQDRCASIHDTIKKNSLALFKRQKPKNIPKASLKLSALASDRYLFSRLYIASQQREGDIGEFFMHENQPYPPAISEFGSLRFGKKSDLLSCISKGNHNPEAPAIVDAKVFDGAALVHSMPVSSATTFDEYANKVFCPFLERSLRNTSRLDVVWDDYRENSLKEATRAKRGQGIRRKVMSSYLKTGQPSCKIL